MRILFFVVALYGVLVASEETEFNEPSLCAQETNPFSYTHCIKKRDAGCQNGGFCGTCNTNSCQTCNGNNCRTTCNGNGCTQCPSGDCCNSQNCNVCSGMNCCNSNSCNSCTNNCNSGCSTHSCRSACLQVCQTVTNQCNCNSEQNNCFIKCRNDCSTDGPCYENCSKNCTCTTPCPTTSPGSLVPEKTFVNISNNPVHTNAINVSTIINLRNIIINQNSIHNPINITNIQHTPQVGTITEPPKKCCYVIHPIHCFDIENPPYKRCIQKRHWECSDICISVVVHLVRQQKETIITQVKDRVVERPYPIIVPGGQPPWPQPQTQLQQISRCHFTGHQNPWITCGHIGVQGCGSCYVCGNQQYNPTLCSTQTTCPGLCRGGIIYDYNIGQQVLRYATFYGPNASRQIGVPIARNLQG